MGRLARWSPGEDAIPRFHNATQVVSQVLQLRESGIERGQSLGDQAPYALTRRPSAVPDRQNPPQILERKPHHQGALNQKNASDGVFGYHRYPFADRVTPARSLSFS